MLYNMHRNLLLWYIHAFKLQPFSILENNYTTSCLDSAFRSQLSIYLFFLIHSEGLLMDYCAKANMLAFFAQWKCFKSIFLVPSATLESRPDSGRWTNRQFDQRIVHDPSELYFVALCCTHGNASLRHSRFSISPPFTELNESRLCIQTRQLKT